MVWEKTVSDTVFFADPDTVSLHTGRPLGSDAFTASIEPSTRRLAPRKGGRPRKSAADPR
jgi:hypothetical protein